MAMEEGREEEDTVVGSAPAHLLQEVLPCRGTARVRTITRNNSNNSREGTEEGTPRVVKLNSSSSSSRAEDGTTSGSPLVGSTRCGNHSRCIDTLAPSVRVERVREILKPTCPHPSGKEKKFNVSELHIRLQT